MDHSITGVEGELPTVSVVQAIKRMDKRVLKPMLTSATPPLKDVVPSCCLPLAKCFTSEEQEQVQGDTCYSDVGPASVTASPVAEGHETNTT